MLALGIHYQSAEAYRFMSQIFMLRSERTLERCVSRSVKLEPGFCEPLIAALEKKVNSLEDIEKYCTVLLDEMSIKALLSYPRIFQSIHGLQFSCD